MKRITREQLAKFCPDTETIRAFEELFGEGFTLEDVLIAAQNAANQAVQALSTLESIKQIVEFLIVAPTVQIGTMGEQQASNVAITGGNATGLTAVTATTVTGTIINTIATWLIENSDVMPNGFGVGLGTLTNAPAAGDPAKWIPVREGGVTRYIPAW